MYADVLVSEAVDEFILGYDWLARNKCEWLFGLGRIVINGTSVQLLSRASRPVVRRIFVRETVAIPPDCNANVPVRSFVNLHTPRSDWLTKPAEVKPGLLAARTLLSDSDEYAAISFMNVSGTEQSLRSGHSLGVALPCDVDSEREEQTTVKTVDDRDENTVVDSGDTAAAPTTADGGDDVMTETARVRMIDSGGQPSNETLDYSHVQPVIDKLPSTLTDEHRAQATALIQRNADVFSRHEFDVGCTNLLTARIQTESDRPIAEPLRRHARVHLDVIDQTIDRMKAAGIVEDANSPWSANLVVVAKKDELGRPVTPRITMDFRGLNSITYKDKFPLPHIQDCLRTLDRATYMSVIDLSNSYFQVPIHEDDRDKTAFRTRRGQFRLTRLGQGCTNSPAVFCRLMTLVLRGLTCSLAYIDDTICFSRSFDDHLVDLEQVLNRFRQADLKLKPTKCSLFQSRVKFVGHYVSAQGIEVDSDKIACIVNWPFPKTISELRGFLGLCSYYREFCQGFASVADPLTECLRKGVALRWTPGRQAAFDKLKNMLTTAPVLAVPRDDEACIYRLDCDASGVGASAILEQWQDGIFRVIEYASRTFSAAERAYCATRREMAALIFGLKQFKAYLLGRHFQIRVDNMALTFYQKMKDPTGQAARFLEILSNYSFDIIHRSGARHTNADSVSRLRPCEVNGGEPCAQCNRRVTGRHSVNAVRTRAQRAQQNFGDAATEAVADRPPAANMTASGGRPSNGRCSKQRRRIAVALNVTAPAAWQASAGWTPAEIRAQQLADGDIAPALAWKEDGVRPPWSEIQGSSPMLRALWQQFDSLEIRDGVLYRQFYNRNGIVCNLQLILPIGIKVPFLELIHADTAGHLKLVKCVPHVMRRAWWHNWKRDLKLFIKCCPKCESFHRGPPPKQANLRPMLVGAPGERWAVDLTGPHCMSNGYKYMFTAICPFSKFGICVPIRDKQATTVAKALVDHVFLRWGLCHELLTDLGKEFEAELLQELLKLLGVVRLKTSGYRPQTNGVCEVWHRTLNAMLAKVINDNQKNWSEWIQYIVFCYNSTTHSATGFSPFFIFTGREPLWNVDFLLANSPEGATSLPQYVAMVTERLAKASEIVRCHLKSAADSASRWYNQKNSPRHFDVGSHVRVYYPRRFKGKSPKWQSFFKTEGEIVKKLNDATYLIKSKSWKSPKVVHVDKLKLIETFQ